MARIIETEARISAIDATGEVFERIAQKVRGLSTTMRSFGSTAQSFSGAANRSIGAVGRTMRTLSPLAAGAASYEGMRGVRDIIHDTAQQTAARAHEAVRMEASGMSEAEIADAERVSQDLSERYKALSTTTIMHALRNMRAIVGTYEEAGKILDPILKLRIAAMGAHPERAAELSDEFDKLVKGMEIKGVTMDPEKFTSYMQGMAKAINVFGDTLHPYDYYQMFKYGSTAAQALSEKFMLETAPTFAQEMGGSRTGSSLAMFYSKTVGDSMTLIAANELKKFGLIDMGKVQSKAGRITKLSPGAVRGWELAAADPYAWVNNYLLPAFARAGVTDKQKILGEIATIFGSGRQSSGALVAILATQQARIEKDWKLIHGAKGLDAADLYMGKDPMMAWSGVTEQFKNLLAIAGGPLAGPAAAGLNVIASGIAAIERAASAHPRQAAAYLAAGTTGLLGVAGAAGLWALHGLYGVGKNLIGAGGKAADIVGADAYSVMQAAQTGGLAAEAGPSLLGAVGASAGLLGMLPLAADASIWAGKKAQDYFGNVDMNQGAPGVGYVPGMPMPEVKGSADLNVSVKVEPSDSFISRIVSALENDINAFGGGTSGSTGVSMPEAVAAP